MVSIISEHITINPGFCGGQPCITGHRIKVQDVVIWHEEMCKPKILLSFSKN
ncbi:MAG: DUF433 domain-containing protein [Oscillatoriales cyanobacterium]|nr:MAG: DUF433 domain-containing protein [Oscillatoriales cyanobacterium]